MDIRNSLEGLGALLGVNTSAPSSPQSKSGTSSAPSTFDSDRATFSSAGSEVSQAASNESVRANKVASVQAALAAGTYNVPASAVASRMISSMLADGQAGSPS